MEHWGVAVAGRAPKTRESRQGSGEGDGVWGGAVPLPRKFMNFSSQNSVIWCILGVLFLRFMCPVDCSYPRESEGLCFYRRWFVCLSVCLLPQ